MSVEDIVVVQKRITLTATQPMTDDIRKQYEHLQYETSVLLEKTKKTKDDFKEDRFKNSETLDDFLKKVQLPHPISRYELRFTTETQILHRYRKELKIYQDYIKYFKSREEGRTEANYGDRFGVLSHFIRRVKSKVSNLIYLIAQLNNEDTEPEEETVTDVNESLTDDDVFYFLKVFQDYQAACILILSYYANRNQ